MDLHQHAPQQDAAPPATDLRASDADRDRIADMLREALAEGRLTADEHAERVGGVLSAKTVGELDVFVRDLPAAHQRRSAPAAAPFHPAPGALPAEPDDNVVAVFGAAVRKGRRRAGRRIHVYAVFGSVEIDLSEAVFEYQQVVIKAFSVFGSVDVRVPENVTLRGAGGAVLGSFEVDTADSAEPEAPVVLVDGWAVLGSVEARPKRGRLIEDILHRVQRTVDRHVRKHL
ncbi:DUF1707 SHOCT-like domain-containing protein [Streptomyces daghestanicus]|uniref:Cell wall-active antibiotics response LiaF-like C-terminal domain-containing protein n=1 Tax=Streptomyces daghestanicus TaxID=66885 RepID=A0ABQ3Q1R0_9ACTN|nr:DUF1707 domain-containing protein [Streptomyces daghestanicus]GGU40904.1 hypothetical protein GCM10010259_34730 [Streptomyces daghestanicus]GHI31201.1 hypothetical protein Sdagh_29310 [Streptomyces daghestanicus]